MKQTIVLLAINVAALLCLTSASACIWDSDTLFQERLKSPGMARAILGSHGKAPDRNRLTERIEKLHKNPQKDDPAWWNNLAGAHIRLGQTHVAVELLESVVDQFTNDYGIHANLGTAYHLLKRYSDAEKHIARDLEINPNGHFGLEKYHLALLQYLLRDDDYRKQHVYVDEFSRSLQVVP